MIPDDKRWLNYVVDGESLLQNSDRKFIEELFSVAETEAKSRLRYVPGNDGVINKKLSVVRENLQCIVERLKLCKEAKKDFIRRFPNWQELRKENVKSLLDLGNSMHKDRQNCNVSRLVGHCASLVGGGITIASAVMIPFTAGLATPFAVAGGALTAAGSTTSIGTSVTEIAIRKKKASKASTILDEDKKSLEELKEWLEHASGLAAAIDSLASIDIEKDAVNTMKDLVGLAIKVTSAVQRNQIAKDFVLFTFEHLQLNCCTNVLIVSSIVGLLGIVMLLYNYNSQLFKNASNSMSIAENFTNIMSVSSKVVQIASTVIKTDAQIASNVGKAVTRGVFAAFGMFIDIASITLTSIDVHKGSLSKSGEKIIHIAEQLEAESDTLETVFYELIEHI